MGKQKKGSAKRAVAQAEFMDAVVYMMREQNKTMMPPSARRRLARLYIWEQRCKANTYPPPAPVWTAHHAAFVAGLEVPWEGDRTAMMKAMGILEERARPWAGI